MPALFMATSLMTKLCIESSACNQHLALFRIHLAPARNRIGLRLTSLLHLKLQTKRTTQTAPPVIATRGEKKKKKRMASLRAAMHPLVF